MQPDTWYAELSGDPAELEMLAATFERSPVHLEVDPTSACYVLKADWWDQSLHPHDLADAVGNLLAWLNGSLTLIATFRSPIASSTMVRYDVDGQRRGVIIAKPTLTIVHGLPPTLSVERADGTVEVRRPTDPVRNWIAAASKSIATAKLLRLLGSDGRDWSALYRMYEIIEREVGGPEAIEAAGWTTAATIRRFKHTANSPTAAGDAARHGLDRTDPPRNPMRLAEARVFVTSLAAAWLDRCGDGQQFA